MLRLRLILRQLLRMLKVHRLGAIITIPIGLDFRLILGLLGLGGFAGQYRLSIMHLDLVGINQALLLVPRRARCPRSRDRDLALLMLDLDLWHRDNEHAVSHLCTD